MLFLLLFHEVAKNMRSLLLVAGAAALASAERVVIKYHDRVLGETNANCISPLPAVKLLGERDACIWPGNGAMPNLSHWLVFEVTTKTFFKGDDRLEAEPTIAGQKITDPEYRLVTGGPADRQYFEPRGIPDVPQVQVPEKYAARSQEAIKAELAQYANPAQVPRVVQYKPANKAAQFYRDSNMNLHQLPEWAMKRSPEEKHHMEMIEYLQNQITRCHDILNDKPALMDDAVVKVANNGRLQDAFPKMSKEEKAEQKKHMIEWAKLMQPYYSELLHMYIRLWNLREDEVVAPRAFIGKDGTAGYSTSRDEQILRSQLRGQNMRAADPIPDRLKQRGKINNEIQRLKIRMGIAEAKFINPNDPNFPDIADLEKKDNLIMQGRHGINLQDKSNFIWQNNRFVQVNDDALRQGLGHVEPGVNVIRQVEVPYGPAIGEVKYNNGQIIVQPADYAMNQAPPLYDLNQMQNQLNFRDQPYKSYNGQQW